MTRWVRQLLVTVLVACILCAGCVHSQKTPSTIPPASKARIEALIDVAMQLKVNNIEVVPYSVFREAVLVSIDIWETYAICVVDREELIQLASIDLAEMQGHLNKQTARADKNARWIWYMAGGGIVLSIVTLIIGGLAL